MAGVILILQIYESIILELWTNTCCSDVATIDPHVRTSDQSPTKLKSTRIVGSPHKRSGSGFYWAYKFFIIIILQGGGFTLCESRCRSQSVSDFGRHSIRKAFVPMLRNRVRFGRRIKPKQRNGYFGT